MSVERPRRLILHVGYPKTATTTVQKSVFEALDGVVYLAKPFSEDVAALERVVLTASDSAFDAQLPASRTLLESLLAASGASLAIFSHEGFLRFDRHREWGGNPIRRTGSRLFRLFDGLFPTIDVLITIREQAGMVESFCQHFSLLSDVQQDFRAYVDGAIAHPTKGLLGSLHYGAVCDHYASIFGGAHIHVLPYERLGKDVTAFSAVLAALVDRDAATISAMLDRKALNTSRRSGAGRARRDRSRHPLSRIRRRLPSGFRPTSIPGATRVKEVLDRLWPAPDVPIAYGPGQRDALRAVFHASNRALDEAHDLGLDGLGYAM